SRRPWECQYKKRYRAPSFHERSSTTYASNRERYARHSASESDRPNRSSSAVRARRSNSGTAFDEIAFDAIPSGFAFTPDRLRAARGRTGEEDPQTYPSITSTLLAGKNLWSCATR